MIEYVELSVIGFETKVLIVLLLFAVIFIGWYYTDKKDERDIKDGIALSLLIGVFFSMFIGPLIYNSIHTSPNVEIKNMNAEIDTYKYDNMYEENKLMFHLKDTDETVIVPISYNLYKDNEEYLNNVMKNNPKFNSNVYEYLKSRTKSGKLYAKRNKDGNFKLYIDSLDGYEVNELIKELEQTTHK